MANKIVLKKSSVASKVPLSTDLEVGEIAVNLTDQKLYSKKSDGTVILVGSGVSGGGDVVGPASATDNAIARFDSTTGKLIQNSTVTIDDNGTLANVNAISLDTTPTTPPTTAGTIYWDEGNGTPSVVLNASTELQLGQENIAKVYNGSGATIPNGAVVAVNGAQGQRPQVTLADADTESLSAPTLGIATESIANGAEGFICTFGLVRGLDTSAFIEGLPIYLSQTAGQFTQTRPSAPAHTVALGWVIKVNASSGEVFVNINNGWELDELHNVLITSPSSGNTLIYDAVANVWKNANITAGTGISVTNGAGSITVNNTGVTSVSGTGTVNGLTLSGTVTTTGNLTLGGTPSGTWDISVTGNAGTVTNGVYTVGDQTIAGNKTFTGIVNGTFESSNARFKFKAADADGGNYALIGLDWGGTVGTYKDFEVYDYVNGRALFRSFGATRNFEVYGSISAASLAGGAATGTGASGTWGISISGNAATITNQANSATITASTTAGAANTIVRRDGNGYIFNNYFNSTDNSQTGAVTAVMVKAGDNYLRSGTAAAVASFLSGQSMNISGSASNNLLLSGGTMTGLLATVTNNATFTGANDSTFSVRGNTSYAASMSFHRTGAYAVNLGLDTDNVFKLGGWSAGGVPHYWDMSGNAWATASMRSPIFYDSNDTGYYIDPNTTATAARLRGQILIGPNTSDRYLRIGGNGGAVDYATVSTSNGNLHIDCQSGYGLYLNYYNSNPIEAVNLRSNIYYDRDNTGYFLDPAANSSIRTVGDWRADSSAWTGEFAGKIQYHASNWYLQFAGELIGRNSGGGNVFSVNTAGVASASGDMRAPIFYDNNDTAWYCDPNNTSRFNVLTVPSSVGSGTFPISVNSVDRGIIFGNSSGSGISCYFTVNSGGTVSGSIIASGGSTTYNTSSDYRMKENVQPIDKEAALAKIMSVQPVTFNWIQEHGGDAALGFIAHILQQSAPECVHGEKDAVNENGTIKPQGVDASKLIPSICAAMQKQQELIEQLMAQVAALKGN